MDELKANVERAAAARRVRPTRVPRRPVVRFSSARQVRLGQVVFDRVKEMPCLVIGITGTVVRLVRPGGQPWETDLQRLSPGTPYHQKQLDALARHVEVQKKGIASG